jgi:hypothetical protein
MTADNREAFEALIAAACNQSSVPPGGEQDPMMRVAQAAYKRGWCAALASREAYPQRLDDSRLRRARGLAARHVRVKKT